MSQENNTTETVETTETEFLTSEEILEVVAKLKAMPRKVILQKEFTSSKGDNIGKKVVYLYIPVSLPSEFHSLAIPFGTLSIKGYQVTKVTKSGLSVANPGVSIDTFENTDIDCTVPVPESK